MFKEFLIVGCGSFLGGGARFMISRAMQGLAIASFPLGTFAVNVLGCLIIGLVSGLGGNASGWLNGHVKLLLTTGFCGGFTTFSTFMNENTLLLKSGNCLMLALYVAGSLALGFAAVIAGYQLSKLL